MTAQKFYGRAAAEEFLASNLFKSCTIHGMQVINSERIFSALDIRPAGAAFLENAGWNYCVFTKQLVPIFGTCPGGTRLNGGRDGA